MDKGSFLFKNDIFAEKKKKIVIYPLFLKVLSTCALKTQNKKLNVKM